LGLVSLRAAAAETERRRRDANDPLRIRVRRAWRAALLSCCDIECRGSAAAYTARARALGKAAAREPQPPSGLINAAPRSRLAADRPASDGRANSSAASLRAGGCLPACDPERVERLVGHNSASLARPWRSASVRICTGFPKAASSARMRLRRCNRTRSTPGQIEPREHVPLRLEEGARLGSPKKMTEWRRLGPLRRRLSHCWAPLAALAARIRRML
jgi:hypothetical protein